MPTVTVNRHDHSRRESRAIDDDSNFQKCHNVSDQKIRGDNRLKAVVKKSAVHFRRDSASVKHSQKKIRCSNKRNVEIYSLTFRIKGGRGSFKQICRWATERGGKTTSGAGAGELSRNANVKKFINTTPRCHCELSAAEEKRHERAYARLAVWNVA